MRVPEEPERTFHGASQFKHTGMHQTFHLFLNNLLEPVQSKKQVEGSFNKLNHRDEFAAPRI